MLMGSKCLREVGTAVFYDAKNRFKAIINYDSNPAGSYFGPKRMTDAFEGKIFKAKPGTKFKRYKNNKEIQEKESKMVGKGKEIGKIKGSWIKNLEIDGKEYWNINDGNLPDRCIPTKECLPFDARFREDLIWVKYDDFKRGEKWKLLLE